MNRLAKWTMRLYPVRWRRRYGDELDALLAETGADTRVVAELALGQGPGMQFSTWSFPKLAVVLGDCGVCCPEQPHRSDPPAPICESKRRLCGNNWPHSRIL